MVSEQSTPGPAIDWREQWPEAAWIGRRIDGLEGVRIMIDFMRAQDRECRIPGDNPNRHYWDGVVRACKNIETYCFEGVIEFTRIDGASTNASAC